MKRCDVYIMFNADGGQKKVAKVKGYIFMKSGHWFTARRRNPEWPSDERYKKWVISDLVTGLVMTSTDSKRAKVPDAIPDSMIEKLLYYYDDRTTSLYRQKSTHDEFREYARQISKAMALEDIDNPQLDCMRESGQLLFHE